ncbi:unnamed protein product [Euphydryas editha]|uniref:Uncharacterized protein n=1 Tax=Euphydryas editha TaxID=104508 RepID=A0AAU9V9T9_EUPED|nr:unnamed protein product [Euphydryas editha]
MSISRSSMWRALSHSRLRAPLALLACAALLTVRVPRSASLAADFPSHSPSALAHFLADFSNHPRLYSHITGSWGVEEEKNNYTSWHYVVSYECGGRCTGHVQLSAHDDGGGRHRVHVQDTRCSMLPLLPWPQICESSMTETEISPRKGGGAHLEERARVHCGAFALATSCNVAEARRRHLRVLRDALAQI